METPSTPPMLLDEFEDVSPLDEQIEVEPGDPENEARELPCGEGD